MPEKLHYLRLAPLLQWRKRTEDERRRRWALLQRQHDESVHGLEALMDARRSVVRHAGRASVAAAVDAAVTRQERCTAAATACLHAARGELIAAARARRSIELLMARRRHAYEHDQSRREAYEFDEANARRRIGAPA